MAENPEKPGAPAHSRVRAVLHASHAVLRLASPRRLGRTWAWLREIVAQVRRRRAEPRLTGAVDGNPFSEPLTGVGWYLHQIPLHPAERDAVPVPLYGPR